MDKLTPKDIKEVRGLYGVLPQRIAVAVRRTEDGGFVARVTSFKGVITEATTFSELIDMITDAVFTYFDIPEKYRPFLPAYVPPVEMAQQLNLLPSARREEESVTMQLTPSAPAAPR